MRFTWAGDHRSPLLLPSERFAQEASRVNAQAMTDLPIRSIGIESERLSVLPRRQIWPERVSRNLGQGASPFHLPTAEGKNTRVRRVRRCRGQPEVGLRPSNTLSECTSEVARPRRTGTPLTLLHP